MNNTEKMIAAMKLGLVGSFAAEIINVHQSVDGKISIAEKEKIKAGTADEVRMLAKRSNLKLRKADDEQLIETLIKRMVKKGTV